MAYYGNPRANYGSAPYGESAFKMALRNLIAGSAGIGAGLGAVRPGSNFADAFLQSAGRSSLAVQQAQQVAQDYAMRQQEIKRRREEDEVQRRYTEALIKQTERPEKPQKYQPMTREEYLADLEEQLRLEAKYRPQPKEVSDKPKLGDLNTIVDNFRADKDVQNFTVVRDNVRRIESNAKLGTGQGDLAVIFAYMRVLDPESVVRETEFKNAAEAMGRLQMMTNIPARWVSGNRLTPEGRKGFLQSARTLYEAQRKTYDRKAAMFQRQAKAYGVDPTMVVPDYSDEDEEFIFDEEGNLVPK